MNTLRQLQRIAIVSGIILLTGCAAAHTAISKRNLDVQTKMSDTIFLDPVKPSLRTVFVQVRNTSDKPDLSIETPIKTAIRSRGYTVTDDPDKAHYMLQANILQVGKSDAREIASSLAGGFGGALAGAAVGSQFGSGDGSMAMGIAGAAIGIFADAMVKDVYFSIITDLQISERAKDGVIVTEDNQARLKQGNSGYKAVTSTETTDWKRYQTRIVSSANKVNLEFSEAQPVLIQGLQQSISGIL